MLTRRLFGNSLMLCITVAAVIVLLIMGYREGGRFFLISLVCTEGGTLLIALIYFIVIRTRRGQVTQLRLGEEFPHEEGADSLLRPGREHTRSPPAISGQESTRPPSSAKFLLVLIVPQRDEALIGDLEERYNFAVAELGVRAAQRQYLWEVLKEVVPLVWARIEQIAKVVAALDRLRRLFFS